MSDGRLFSFRNFWFTTSLSITAGVAVVAALAGFVLLPMVQQSTQFAGMWDAICSAAGLIRTPTAQPIVHTDYRTSGVMVTPQMLRDASSESIGRGATFALRCTMCHGARGLSEANSPNLAGQYPAVIYKQLLDFKSGARMSGVMAPLVTDLSDQDMRELAAYYAYLPRLPPYHPAVAGSPPPIVLNGAPMRNIAPCGSCHGGLANKTGSAWLEGQPEAYLRAQLIAFASGARHNDISEQMRNVARNMTPTEIDEAARYYASQPGEGSTQSRSVP
jgi:cytochrome c553